MKALTSRFQLTLKPLHKLEGRYTAGRVVTCWDGKARESLAHGS